MIHKAWRIFNVGDNTASSLMSHDVDFVTRCKWTHLPAPGIISLLYVLFWVIPRRLNFICRRFRTYLLLAL